MTWGSKQSSSSSDRSSSSRVSECRSIHDIISSLRTSFRDADFNSAQNELLSRESQLRRQKDDLDINWRLKYDILDKEFNDLRLEGLHWDAERDRLMRELKVAEDKLSDLDLDLRTAKEKEKKANERCGEAYKDIEVRMRNEQEMLAKLNKEEALYREKLDSLRSEGEELRKKLRDKDERIGELVKEKEQLLRKEKSGMEAMADVKQLMKILSENEEKIKELKAKEVAHLEEMKGKDERIDVLVRDKEGLELEVEGLRAEIKRKSDDGMVSKLWELESLVATWMCNVPRDSSLKDTKVGEILSRFDKFLDSQQAAVKHAHGGDKDSTVASGTNKLAQQVVDHDVVIVLPGATVKEAVGGVINLDSESSSDDDDHQHRKRKYLSDCTSNPKDKVKKFNHPMTHKSVKVELSTPLKQTVSTVRKCNENSMDERNTQGNGTSTEATPNIKKLLDACRRGKGSISSLKQGA